ncbi:hypothetical protein AB205_0010700 [Aquarana catesbeiana]|uniref:Uncharacterized protein n=1 Tax=Aquarana catesbeiana TaxID=8400 RepID=A0A2G9SIK8_AQUCT|nr:hypothetical protein AB205_0010700 [Aquarana catesbeiana]
MDAIVPMRPSVILAGMGPSMESPILTTLHLPCSPSSNALPWRAGQTYSTGCRMPWDMSCPACTLSALSSLDRSSF